MHISKINNKKFRLSKFLKKIFLKNVQNVTLCLTYEVLLKKEYIVWLLLEQKGQYIIYMGNI